MPPVRTFPGTTGARSILGNPVNVPQERTPPGAEIGAESQRVGGMGGWAAFVDEAEFVPELTWPSSIQTYHKMRSDSQIEALHEGTTKPVREFRWSLSDNGADAKMVERAAADLGLPRRGEEDEDVPMAANKFDFDAFLADTLLALIYGFFHFEVVGENREAEWHMVKLAPRHPRLVMEFAEDESGALTAIRQNVQGAQGWAGALPPPIPASKLVPFVWRPEAGSHVGRSMLRSLYREWLIKDRVIRIAAVNLERAGGVPVAIGAQGMDDEQLKDLAQMARQFKVAEGAGGALPFGSKLELAGGSVPDAVSLLQYCDECMARVWALMLIQLGTTSTGNRALGAEFAIYAARAQRAMAKWVAARLNNFLERYAEWNDPYATHAPRIYYEPSKPEGMSVTDLVSLISSGALTVDPELEEWLRNEYGLPEKPEPPDGGPDLGALTPDEVALIQSKRNPPALLGPDGKPVQPTGEQTPAPGQPGATATKPSLTIDPTSQSPTLASIGSPTGIERVHHGIRASLTLPDRELRRLPSENEIRAAVDFRALDTAHREAVTKLHEGYLRHVLPEQIKTIGDQVRGVIGGVFRPQDAAALAAPAAGTALIAEQLTAASASGTLAALREARAQGVDTSNTAVAEADLARRVRAQADTVANLNANGLSLAAQRKAAQLAGAAENARNPHALARALEDHLKGQKHVWEREQLRGAVTFAQNMGRLSVFDALHPEQPGAAYEASELLDDRTCDPCAAIDGTVYETPEAAEADYAGGGFVDCEGGPNCRGTIVAVYPEQNPETGEGRLEEAEPAYTQPGEGGEPIPGEPSIPGVESPAAITEPEAIESAEDASAYIRDTLGYGDIPIEWGELAKATGNYKPGSQAEMDQSHALEVLRGIGRAMRDTREGIGVEATRVTAIRANTTLAADRQLPDTAVAATRPSQMHLGESPGDPPSLIVNDSRGLEDLASKDKHLDTGGFVSKASRDPYGWWTHEMGHVVSMNTRMRAMIPELLRDVQLSPAQPLVKSISDYATTNSDEAWAESFATLMREGGLDEKLGVELTAEDRQRLEAARLDFPPDDHTLKAALRALRERWNAVNPTAALPVR